MNAKDSSILSGAMYLTLAAATVAGGWAAVATLLRGHIDLNTTQHVAWGLWVAVYIYFLGLSAGSFLLSTLVYGFGVKRLERAGPIALVQALVCLLLGGMMIILDLGHPLRGYKVLTSMNPTSVMAWMGVFYNAYIAVILATLYFALRPALVKAVLSRQEPAWLYRFLSLGDRDTSDEAIQRDGRILKTLAFLGIPIALLVSGGVGVIFAVAKARPDWFGGLLPVVFIISALASGGALLTALVGLSPFRDQEVKAKLMRDLAALSVGMLAFDALLLFCEMLVTLYGGIPHEAIGWRLTLFGPFWWVFWFVQVGIGLIVPVAIFLSPLSRSVKWLGTLGACIAVGFLGTRLNIVIPPQIQPTFDALPDAYFHARNAYGYFPSMTEWLGALFAFAVGGWCAIAANKYLPLHLEDRHER